MEYVTGSTKKGNHHHPRTGLFFFLWLCLELSAGLGGQLRLDRSMGSTIGRTGYESGDTERGQLRKERQRQTSTTMKSGRGSRTKRGTRRNMCRVITRMRRERGDRDEREKKSQTRKRENIISENRDDAGIGERWRETSETLSQTTSLSVSVPYVSAPSVRSVCCLCGVPFLFLITKGACFFFFLSSLSPPFLHSSSHSLLHPLPLPLL